MPENPVVGMVGFLLGHGLNNGVGHCRKTSSIAMRPEPFHLIFPWMGNLLEEGRSSSGPREVGVPDAVRDVQSAPAGSRRGQSLPIDI